MSTPANWQPSSPPPKRSKVKPIAITILCGFLLGLGSCFGFLSTFRMSGPSNSVNTLCAIGFGLGLMLFLGGSIWALVALLVHLFSEPKEK